MGGWFFRFVFALPIAIAATVGLYLLFADRFGDTPLPGEQPIPVAEAPEGVLDSLWDEILSRCECVWFSEPWQESPENSYTRNDKAASEPPQLPECDEGCAPGKPEIVVDFPQRAQRRVDLTPAPGYPPACIEAGAEGVVIVEFDISPEGTVENPRIIESPDACFNREVLRTVSKFRYRPSADAQGRAQWRRGERKTIAFELAE